MSSQQIERAANGNKRRNFDDGDGVELSQRQSEHPKLVFRKYPRSVSSYIFPQLSGVWDDVHEIIRLKHEETQCPVCVKIYYPSLDPNDDGEELSNVVYFYEDSDDDGGLRLWLGPPPTVGGWLRITFYHPGQIPSVLRNMKLGK